MSLGNRGDNWVLMTCISTYPKHSRTLIRCGKFWLISMANWFARKCAVILLSNYDRNALTRYPWIVRWKTWSEVPRFFNVRHLEATAYMAFSSFKFLSALWFLHLLPKSLDFLKVTKMFWFPEDLIWLSTVLIPFYFWKRERWQQIVW